MNDRFKFRVFLKYNQAMYDIDSFCYLEGLNKSVFHFKQGGQKTLKNDDFVLIQSTGLKDKNGKLIYDGDFLRYPATETYYANHFMFCEVFWHNNDCCDNHIGWQMNRYHNVGGLMEINFGTKYKFMPKNTEKMEIIGNRYENKDLLNA